MSHRVIYTNPDTQNQLGKPGDPDIPPDNFSCFWGNPFRGTDGNWRCPDGYDGSINNQQFEPRIRRPETVIPPRTTTPPIQTVDDDDDLIFGFEPKTLMIVAAVGAGLYFMSQAGDEGNKR